MNNFDYSGYGVFESLAQDAQDERRAARKALVTAQARVASSLGQFFALSKSPEEFDERYSLVQQEFVATVREAAAEFGVNPNTIGNTILSHYRTAADKESKCAACARGDHADCTGGSCECNPCGSKTSAFIKGSPDPGDDAYFGGEHGSAKKAYDSMIDQYGEKKGEEVYYATRNKKKGKKDSKKAKKALKRLAKGKTAEKWIQKATEDPDFEEGGLHRATGMPEDEKIPEKKIQELKEHGTPDEKKKAQFAENVKKGGVDSFLAGESEQGSCSACGKDGYLKNGLCGPCRKEKWDSEGHQSSLRWAAKGFDEDDDYERETEDLPTSTGGDSNTGLGDQPSPKMDKSPARKDGDTGWSTGDDADELAPSKKHPTERIDPTKVMPRENIKTTVKDQVKGIGESVTESQTLPSPRDYDSAGFADNNMDMAPNTKTFPSDSREESPVTTQSVEDGGVLHSSSMRWAADAGNWGQATDPMRGEWTPEQVDQPQLCPRCKGQGCNDCQGTGKINTALDQVISF